MLLANVMIKKCIMKSFCLCTLFISIFLLLSEKNAMSQDVLRENFEGTFPPTGWTIINAGQFFQGWLQNTSSFNAKSGTKSMNCSGNQFYMSNAWAITPALNLTSDSLYRISYWYSGSSTSGYTEKLKVTIGNGALINNQNSVIHDYTFSNTVYIEGKDTITVNQNGAYNIGFNCYSAANQGRVLIDSIVIQQIHPSPCSGLPSIGIISGPSEILPNENFTLKLSGHYAFISGLTFQWQSSSFGSNIFTDIPGANGTSLTTSEGVNKDYRCTLTCANSGLVTTSNIISVICSNEGSMYREKFNGQNTNGGINGMHFLSSSEGYVAFSDAAGYTLDSGQTFVRRPVTISNTNFNGYTVNLTFGFAANGVYAFSRDSVLIYGDFGAEPAILFSANNGLNWKLVFHQSLSLNSDIGNSFFDMKFWNSATGVAINQKYIVQTTDRGQTWVVRYQISNAVNSRHARLSLPAAGVGYSIAGDKLFRTNNNGNSWTEIQNALPLNSGLNFNTIFFLNASVGYILKDDNYNMYKTTSGGTAWVKTNNEAIMPVLGSDIYFTNENIGYISTKYGYNVMKTTNGGSLWEICKKNTGFQFLNFGMEKLFFLNNNTGWASGRGEYLMMTTTAGTPTLPKALFKIDTTNVSSSDTVRMFNFSKPYYQYKWYKNGVFIGSGYNSTYIHNIFQIKDTITLIVNNGADTDTLVQYQDFPIPALPPPVISSFTPSSGVLGTVVNITGSNLFFTTSVSFGGIPASSFIVDDTAHITAKVSEGTTGEIKVIAPNGIATKAGFIHNGPPIIKAFYPLSAGPSTEITITGTNLTNVQSVNFGGQAALSFRMISPTLLKATTGYGNSGDIVINTINGRDTIPDFVFIRPPVITSFSPQSGNVGTLVSITGNDFNTVADSNIVYFGAVRARIVSATSSLVVAVVPPGATYKCITLATNGLVASSAIAFTVTFPGGGNTFLQSSFSERVRFTAEYQSQNAMIKDLDGNGMSDISVGNESGLSTYRNLSNIDTLVFASHTNFLTDGAAISVNFGDFNGDGMPDIVTANNLGGSASVLKNTSSTGNILFANKIKIPLGHIANDAVAGDFNNDGRLDLAIATLDIDPAIYEIVVFKNTSIKDSISFDSKKEFTVTSGRKTIETVDVDGDGKLDIVSSAVSILRNISTIDSIAFEPRIDYLAAAGWHISIGDIDGDNKPDIVTSNNGGSNISILKNMSVAGSISFAPIVHITVGNFPWGISLTDMDGDGKPEILVVTNNTNSVNGERLQILKNTSTGTTISFANAIEYNTPGASRIDIGDIDLDGKPDIVLANDFDYIDILKNQIGLPSKMCPGGNLSITSNLTGTSYQWQVSTDSITFNGLSNNINYSGVTSANLQLNNIPSSWYGYQYRCIIDGMYSAKTSISFSNTWTGSISSQWENPNNWSCGTVPDSNTDVILNNGTVVLNSASTVRSLKIKLQANLMLTSGASIIVTH